MYVSRYKCIQKHCGFETASRKEIRGHVKTHLATEEKGNDEYGKLKRGMLDEYYLTYYRDFKPNSAEIEKERVIKKDGKDN
jgi:hypothetical protein